MASAGRHNSRVYLCTYNYSYINNFIIMFVNKLIIYTISKLIITHDECHYTIVHFFLNWFRLSYINFRGIGPLAILPGQMLGWAGEEVTVRIAGAVPGCKGKILKFNCTYSFIIMGVLKHGPCRH